MGPTGPYDSDEGPILASDKIGRISQPALVSMHYFPWVQVDLTSSHIVTGFRMGSADGVHFISSARMKIGNDPNTLSYITDASGSPKVRRRRLRF